MIVCHCRVVTDRDVVDALDEGARSVAGVCRSTGAGRDCGSCMFSVKRLVCERHAAVSAVETVLAEAALVSELELPA